MYKRIMIKLSGEALLDKSDSKYIYNREFIRELGEEIKELAKQNVQFMIVTGGGNLWRGARSDDRIDRVISDNMGMLATGMNALYIADCLNELGVKNTVMSPIQVGAVFQQFGKAVGLEALDSGNVIIFACGTGHPFVTTDTAAAIYASELDADIMLALKYKTKGVYSSDPNKQKDAVLFESISYDRIVSDGNIKVMDKAAACICSETGLSTIVLDYEKGNLIKAVSGEKIGTLCKNDKGDE